MLKRPIELTAEAVRIPLTKGKTALVDLCDKDLVSGLNWYALQIGHLFYAATNLGSEKVLLHRRILNAPKELDVDHINGDSLDCRRANIRLCTHAENMINRKIHKHSQTGYKGVSLTNSGKYLALITFQSKRYRIGLYDSIEEAVSAYACAAEKFHGEFRRITEKKI